jgi:non-ribosomal peptide synthetase component F
MRSCPLAPSHSPFVPVAAGLDTRTLQVVSTSFDPHVLDLTATLTSGGCLVLPKPGGHMEPQYIAQLIREQGVTHVLASVPSVSREFVGALGSSYSGLRVWVMIGENLPVPLVDTMHKVS